MASRALRPRPVDSKPASLSAWATDVLPAATRAPDATAGGPGPLSGRGDLDQVALEVAHVGHTLAPGLLLRLRHSVRAGLDRPSVVAFDVIADEADLKHRWRHVLRRGAGTLGQVVGRQLARREGKGGGPGLELGVLPALVKEPPLLAEGALVELEAGRDVAHVEDRVAEPHGAASGPGRLSAAAVQAIEHAEQRRALRRALLDELPALSAHLLDELACLRLHVAERLRVLPQLVDHPPITRSLRS